MMALPLLNQTWLLKRGRNSVRHFRDLVPPCKSAILDDLRKLFVI